MHQGCKACDRVWCFAGALSVLLLIALPALGQDNGRAPLVGVLLVNAAANPEPVAPLLRKALAGLGYVEGSNLHLDFRFAKGHAERFPALAKELAEEKADVIVALGDAATRAAQQATRTIPIVAVADDLFSRG
jgi:putative tryptophan/tyrosine transport system substrate-binding protein